MTVPDDEMPPDPFPPAPSGLEQLDPGHWRIEVDAIPLNLESPDLAEWCDSCLLPSAVGYRFRVLASGLELDVILTLIICHDCGRMTRRTTS